MKKDRHTFLEDLVDIYEKHKNLIDAIGMLMIK